MKKKEIILFILVVGIALMMNCFTKPVFATEAPSVSYSTHVQDIGWQQNSKDGEMAGTSGKSLRLEGIKIQAENLDIKYQVHIENIGWQDWKKNGEIAGTSGKSLRLEAIKILLESSEEYSVMYRVHVQDIGWQDWKTDGELAGTSGKSLRLEGIEIKIVPKEKKVRFTIDSGTNKKVYYQNDSTINISGWRMANFSNNKIDAYIDENIIDNITYIQRTDVISAITGYGTEKENPTPGFNFKVDLTNLQEGDHTIKINVTTQDNEVIYTYTYKFKIDRQIHVTYSGHVQNIGWQNSVQDGAISGTEGRSLRVEALKINLINAPQNAKVKYRTHIQNIGWQDWKTDGQISGTSNQSLRIEALQIKLENLPQYTIEYRAHVQDKGWTSWLIDGETAGTTGESKRIEAIQIRIVPQYKKYYRGIDVSHWQGEINFDKVVATGKIDFIMPRVGWYSETQSKFMVDEQFERNYKQITSRNIPIGTYIYSYATSVEEAKREAQATIQYLKSTGQTKFDLPIFFDMEDPSQINLGKETLTQIAIAFCEEIKAAGYKTGVYSYAYWLLNYMNLGDLPEDYSIWIADFGKNDNGQIPNDIYKYDKYDIWQYTERGQIDGISGYVDMNICYKKD